LKGIIYFEKNPHSGHNLEETIGRDLWANFRYKILVIFKFTKINILGFPQTTIVHNSAKNGWHAIIVHKKIGPEGHKLLGRGFLFWGEMHQNREKCYEGRPKFESKFVKN
jgi:hypothetical protein